MTTRHYGYISLAAVLLAVIAGLLWLRPWSTERLTPIEAASRACTVLQTNHYDLVTSIPVDGDTLTIEARYGDGAQHEVWTVTSSAGVVVDKLERIFKDGKLHLRQGVGPGFTTYYGWESYNSGVEDLDQPLPCLSADGQTSGGAGQEPDTYRVVHTETNDEGDTFTTEFYADSAGAPTNAKVTMTQETGAGSGSGDPNAATGGTSAVIVRHVTFSGIGEENVITAPE